ncbi:hypothetical protein J6590_074583 [Homalodisca vitripennis]|nr:hypothetical protein J6590_074583 [Homalodisca vitripennis]
MRLTSDTTSITDATVSHDVHSQRPLKGRENAEHLFSPLQANSNTVNEFCYSINSRFVFPESVLFRVKNFKPFKKTFKPSYENFFKHFAYDWKQDDTYLRCKAEGKTPWAKERFINLVNGFKTCFKQGLISHTDISLMSLNFFGLRTLEETGLTTTFSIRLSQLKDVHGKVTTMLVNAFIEELAARHDIQVLRLDTISRKYFTRHGLHLSMRGKRLLAEMLVRCLTTVKTRPVCTDSRLSAIAPTPQPCTSRAVPPVGPPPVPTSPPLPSSPTLLGPASSPSSPSTSAPLTLPHITFAEVVAGTSKPNSIAKTISTQSFLVEALPLIPIQI